MLEDIAISIWRSIKWLLRELGSLLLWLVDKVMLIITGVLEMITDILVALDFTGILADLFNKKDKDK